MALTGGRGWAAFGSSNIAASVVDEALAPLGLDARVLGERAALLGLHRRCRTSPGGATRLIQASDGWVALSLARSDDVDLLPA